jgi:hypothetical protein
MVAPSLKARLVSVKIPRFLSGAVVGEVVVATGAAVVAGWEVVGDEVVGDEVVGDEVAGDEVAGDDVAGDDVAGDWEEGEAHPIMIINKAKIINAVLHIIILLFHPLLSLYTTCRK